jgi:hypothetical protein
MGSIDGSESNGLPVGSTNNPAKLAPLSLDQDHSTLPVTPESHLLSGRNQPLETEKKQTHLRNSFNACALTLFNAWLLRQSSKVVTRFISTLFICSPILFFLAGPAGSSLVRCSPCPPNYKCCLCICARPNRIRCCTVF